VCAPEQNRATMSAFQRGFTLGRGDVPDEDQGPAAAAGAEENDQRGEDAR
jgi:hypothetical protein